MLSNAHNLTKTRRDKALDDENKRFGIHVRLVEKDPFASLVPSEWETYHWFADAKQRDSVLADKRRRHEYSRIGDAPVIRYDPVDR